jgi:hypothetical protein
MGVYFYKEMEIGREIERGGDGYSRCEFRIRMSANECCK